MSYCSKCRRQIPWYCLSGTSALKALWPSSVAELKTTTKVMCPSSITWPAPPCLNHLTNTSGVMFSSLDQHPRCHVFIMLPSCFQVSNFARSCWQLRHSKALGRSWQMHQSNPAWSTSMTLMITGAVWSVGGWEHTTTPQAPARWELTMIPLLWLILSWGRLCRICVRGGVRVSYT